MDSSVDTDTWREQARTLIRPRPRVGVITAIILAALFSAIATPIILSDSLLHEYGNISITEGEPSPVTVRIPHFAGFRQLNGVEWSGGAVVIKRGEIPSAQQVAIATEIQAENPSGLSAALAVFLALFLLSCLYTTHLRRSHVGKLVRTQVVTLALILLVAIIVKIAVFSTAVSLFIIPVAGAALVAVLVVDLSAALATGVAAATVVGFLVPFDIATLVVLGVQGVAAALFLGDGKGSKQKVLIAGIMGGLASAIVYLAFYYLSTGASPPMPVEQEYLTIPWIACIAGGALSGIIALMVRPIYQLLLGDITKAKLFELQDLNSKLLKQISEQSPGTWQHSLAMANMAELAANAIGANGRLVRVGAYYHDLGKSLQPSYFIENLASGSESPHNLLSPEVSCDAIFAHVTEGVRVAREAGLPERIIDFMHMHHGDGILEYFWAKCQESGNPKGLSKDRFRYPGVPPQSKETAILAICDAVEAASRTLRKPTEDSITGLVQRIVYGKLHLGQLDDSGLSMSELRKISNSLIKTITHAYHDRIEYPWQRAENTQPGDESSKTSTSNTAKILHAPLDSLDQPKTSHRPSRPLTEVEAAATEQFDISAEFESSAENNETAAVPDAPLAGNASRQIRKGMHFSGPPPATREFTAEMIKDPPSEN